MPSTYSPSLKIQLIGTGEQAGTWGTTTNYNLGTLIEQAITGVITLSMGNANYTMTSYNGLSDEARNAVLVLNGPITAPQYLIAPPQQKTYIVKNVTGNTVTITTSTGNGVAIANSVTAIVYCDSVNFYPATTLNYIDGNLTVTGYSFFQNSVAMATKANATVSVYGNMYGNVNTGQWYLPVGSTSQRAAVGQVGIFRYNSELAIYEGYTGGTWVRFQTYPQGVYTINFLIVAGGGGGSAGGGGGGGVVGSSLSVTPGATYTMVIGGGGAAIVGATAINGTNSSITGVAIAIGGGGGGQTSGASGGSGGGAGPFPDASGGSGVVGQGFNGGGGTNFTSGGGGGGGGVGANAGAGGGNGGIGALNTITGSATYYAGGGGGGGGENQSLGGAGGGGGAASNGGTNTGGGGGGFFNGIGVGNGGSGVIIVSVPTVSYSGITTGAPTVTVSGANTILKFNNSGTYTA